MMKIYLENCLQVIVFLFDPVWPIIEQPRSTYGFGAKN